MAGDAAHGFAEKTEAGRDAMPGRGAGRVRQRYQIESATLVADGEGAADDLVEFFEGQELGDGQFADGNDEVRLKQIDLVVHPTRAVADFIRRRNSIAA